MYAIQLSISVVLAQSKTVGNLNGLKLIKRLNIYYHMKLWGGSHLSKRPLELHYHCVAAGCAFMACYVCKHFFSVDFSVAQKSFIVTRIKASDMSMSWQLFCPLKCDDDSADDLLCAIF